MTASSQTKVLLICFGPFLGRRVNGSATVARAVTRQAWDDSWRIDVVELAVRWGEPQRMLPSLVDRIRPDVVIGLGEGHPGRIAIERIGRNLTARLPDIDGAFPSSFQVLEYGPEQLPARLTLPTWSDGAALPVQLSDDAGRYLCNALLMTLLASTVTKAGFIHLPPQGDQPDASYADPIAPIIAQMIRAQRA